MINVKELRVGNKIFLKGLTITVTAIDIAGSIGYTYDNEDCDKVFIRNSIDPYLERIPITPELLEKAGFEVSLRLDFNEWSLRYYDSVGVTLFLFDTPTSGVIKEKHSSWTNVTIKYLHQLQNLYHSLTGQELKIDL